MAELTITPKRKTRFTVKTPDKISQLKSESRERKLCILHLIHSYLQEQKLFLTSEAFEKECQLTGQYQVCENVDLEIMLQEYQSYYFTKFQKYPKILRKTTENVSESIRKGSCKRNSGNAKTRTPVSSEKNNSSDNEDFHFEIVSYPASLTEKEQPEQPKALTEKIICDIGDFSAEWKEMANQIIKECFLKNLQVKWNDCIGLENSIEKLKEATLYPLNHPQIFRSVEVWKGVLLFGPPGTGKTLMAKALASENFTFINICSSVFTSKWRGESEKMLKVVFDLARYYAPTTIFIDEIDSLVFSTDHQHDASKRFRSEFLTQVDGILSHNQNIFLLACTNLPWSLDAAILRRFDKRLLVNLPSKEDRKALLKHYLPKPNHVQEQEFDYFATLTENFTGSDIKNLCKQATMYVVREKMNELKMKNKACEELRNVTHKDIEQALASIKPCTTSSDINKYFEWNHKYGST